MLHVDKVSSHESMANLIRNGDIVTWKEVEPAALKVGDVILFPRGDKKVLHRLISKDQAKGDMLLRVDLENITEMPYVGRVEYIFRESVEVYQRGRAPRVDYLCAKLSQFGEKLARLDVRLYRPISWSIRLLSLWAFSKKKI